MPETSYDDIQGMSLLSFQISQTEQKQDFSCSVIMITDMTYL